MHKGDPHTHAPPRPGSVKAQASARALAYDKPATHRRCEETRWHTGHPQREPGNLVRLAVAEAASQCLPRKNDRLEASRTFFPTGCYDCGTGPWRGSGGSILTRLPSVSVNET